MSINLGIGNGVMADKILWYFTRMYHWKLWNVIVFDAGIVSSFESLQGGRGINNFLGRYTCYYAALNHDS